MSDEGSRVCRSRPVTMLRPPEYQPHRVPAGVSRLRLPLPPVTPCGCALERRLYECSRRQAPCAEFMRAANQTRQEQPTPRIPQNPPEPASPPESHRSPPTRAQSARRSGPPSATRTRRPRARSVTPIANPRRTGEQFSGAQGTRLKESLCAPPKYVLNERSLPLGLEKESCLLRECKTRAHSLCTVYLSKEKQPVLSTPFIRLEKEILWRLFASVLLNEWFKQGENLLLLMPRQLRDRFEKPPRFPDRTTMPCLAAALMAN